MVEIFSQKAHHFALLVENPKTMPMLLRSQTKSNKTAVVIALIAGIIGFNGIGHLYIGRLTRVASLLIIGWIFVALTFFFIPFGIVYLIFWVWQVYDVNIKAKYFNKYVINNGKAPW